MSETTQPNEPQQPPTPTEPAVTQATAEAAAAQLPGATPDDEDDDWAEDDAPLTQRVFLEALVFALEHTAVSNPDAAVKAKAHIMALRTVCGTPEPAAPVAAPVTAGQVTALLPGRISKRFKR